MEKGTGVALKIRLDPYLEALARKQNADNLWNKAYFLAIEHKDFSLLVPAMTLSNKADAEVLYEEKRREFPHA
jgi:hypothetical protein